MTTPDTSASTTPESLVVGAIGRLRTAQDPQLHRLKRGTELLDAMLEPTFVRVKEQLRAQKFYFTDDLLACALLLLARVDGNSTAPTLASALNRAGYSEMRFATLVRCEEPADLFTQLQRAVRYCQGNVNPFDVTRLVLNWTDARRDQTRKQIIGQFYQTA